MYRSVQEGTGVSCESRGLSQWWGSISARASSGWLLACAWLSLPVLAFACLSLPVESAVLHETRDGTSQHESGR